MRRNMRRLHQIRSTLAWERLSLKDRTRLYHHRRRWDLRLRERIMYGHSVVEREYGDDSYHWINKDAYRRFVHAMLGMRLRARIFAPSLLYARLFGGNCARTHNQAAATSE